MNIRRKMTNLGATLGRVNPAALMRTLAGAAAGARETRRGTVLVLVLGALALISVVTLVYASIGQGDRRASAVVVRKDNVNHVMDAVADRLMAIVGVDALATFVDGYRQNNSPITFREATDYPFTDVYRRSALLGGVTVSQRFNPEGSFHDSVTTTNNDPRLPSDPFLATTLPEALHHLLTSAQPPLPEHYRDWMQISNFATDGRFVNLWNLR